MSYFIDIQVEMALLNKNFTFLCLSTFLNETRPNDQTISRHPALLLSDTPGKKERRININYTTGQYAEMGNYMLAGSARRGCSVSVSGTAFKLHRTRVEVLSAAAVGLTVWLNNT